MTTTRPLTDEEFAAIAERCRRATPGPWTWMMSNDGGGGVIEPYTGFFGEPYTATEALVWLSRDGDWWCADCETVLPADQSGHMPTDADADFIAQSRTDVPRLLQEVIRLKAEVRSLRKCLEGNS